MLDLVIGMCAYDTIRAETFHSFTRLHEETSVNFKVYLRIFDALIGRSRSIVATQFLEKGESDVLLFIDSDMAFTPDHTLKILQAQKDGYDIVAGGYLMANGKLALRTLKGELVRDMGIGVVYEVEYVSTGFMSISRGALAKIKDELELPLLHKNEPDARCYPFFESGRDWSGTHRFYISEDWDFCEKAKQAGLKIYWHTGVLVTHIKSMALIPNASFGILDNIPNQAVVEKVNA